MTETLSATHVRAARLAAAVFALVALATLAHGASAAPTSFSPSAGLRISLVQSATAVPTNGVMGFSGVIRFPASASSVQARLQVRLVGGRLVYQRTQYLDTAEEGTRTFPFARSLDGLGLSPGTYPVTFSLNANIGGSDVTTDVTSQVRVYDPTQRPVSAVLLVKVHARPLADPGGAFWADPSSPAGARARDEVDRIATMATNDLGARVTLAIPPVAIAEWRRFASSGYTLATGTVVPASDPTPVACATTLAHLQQALTTGRLELATMGYADPSLSDLGANKLVADVGPQYDAGLSAIFASLETTPSNGTAPAGGCLPASVQRVLLGRHVSYAFVDAECTRIGKRIGVASGAYPAVDSTMTALVVDARASRGLESGDASATLAHTFERLGTSSNTQPVVLRIDLDDAVSDATATVGGALSALETTPWIRLKLGAETRPPKGARAVSFTSAPTKNAPRDFWSTVRSARSHATGMIAVLTSSDDGATSAQNSSLIAESSEWSEPSAKWQFAKSGLAFASAALKTSNAVFSTIKVSATSITLAGSTGNIPVNIQNGSKKTLTVVVLTKVSSGVNVVGNRAIPTKLAPGETYVQIPIDMQGALSGKVTVQVMAGSVVVAKQTVSVRRSYLDRLALIGGILLLLGGMLVWIVVRVRRAPDVNGYAEEYEEDDEDGEYYDVAEEEPASSLAFEDGDGGARYTESHSDAPTDSD